MTADLERISPFAAWLFSFFGVRVPAWIMVLTAVSIYGFFVILPQLAALGYLDRKLGADIQMRIGPNRVGPAGLFQGIADALKLLFKQDARPGSAGMAFRFAPVLVLCVLFLAVGSIPVSKDWALSSVDSGLAHLLAALLLSRFFLFWSAYSANNPWSALSAFRILAHVSFYLLPLAVAFLPPVLVSGSIDMGGILSSQGGWPWRWTLFHDPGALIGGLVFFGAMHIWQCRAPFDFTSAESEISGGAWSEYSGARKGLVSVIEFAGLYLSCGLFAVLYLGGGNVPFGLDSFGRAASLVHFTALTIKIFALAAVSIWARWSLPRLCAGQVVSFSWKVLLPFGIVSVLSTALWMALAAGKSFAEALGA